MLVPLGQSEIFASPCTRLHTAKPNDSWSRIAARFDISLRTLLSLNGATLKTVIFVGDKICLSNQPVVTPLT
ncbi:MAG: LysM peptidoglycan-binding domain-containing protein, partial [Actinomycetota bacterium]